MSDLYRWNLRWRDVGLPAFPWRPLCWLTIHRDDSYGMCVTCHKALP